MSQQDYPNIQEFYNDFEEDSEILGQGTFGSVFKMKSKRPLNQDQQGKYYAVKLMQANTQKSFEQIQNEYKILRFLPKHQNIINLVKTYAWQKLSPSPSYNLVLVMELEKCSLAAEINTRKNINKPFTDQEFIQIARQCFETFFFLIEKANTFHRDIKPENILINSSQLNIKISDFGVSKRLMEDRYRTIQGTLVGTPVYLSPKLWNEYETNNFRLENIGKIEHNVEKSDIYSLGVTLLQCALLLNQEEVVGLNRGIQGQMKTQNLLKQIQSQKIQSLLKMMLEHDEKQRANYIELIQKILENSSQMQIEKSNSTLGQSGGISMENYSPLSSRNDDNSSNTPTRRGPHFGSQTNTVTKLEAINSQDIQTEPEWESNICPYHENQFIQYYCFSENFQNFCCQICYNQMSAKQVNETLSLEEYNERIKINQFNQIYVQEVNKTKMQLYESQKIQKQMTMQTLELIKIKTLNRLSSILTSTMDDIIKNFTIQQQSLSKKIYDRFDQLLKECQENSKLKLQLNSQHNSSIAQLLKEQSRLIQEHKLIKNRVQKVSNWNQNIPNFDDEFQVLLKQKIKIEYGLGFTEDFNADLLETIIPQKSDQIFESDRWILQDNEKTYLRMETCLKSDNYVSILAISQDDNIYYQCTDNILYRQNYYSKELQKISQLKDQILCFGFYEDNIIFGTDQGRILQISSTENQLNQIYFDENIQITAIKPSQNGIIFGNQNGTIASLVGDLEDLISNKNIMEIDYINTMHESKILKQTQRFEYVQSYKCLVSQSESNILNLHYNGYNDVIKTDLNPIIDVSQTTQGQLLAFGDNSSTLKIWNFVIDENDKITLSLIHQIQIQSYSALIRFSCVNNIILFLSQNHLKGCKIDYEQKKQIEFNLKIKEHSNQAVVSNITQNSEGEFAFSINGVIYIWSSFFRPE